ncbi:uncharacterized protein LOC144066181 isoform X2 [Stigmatopora argus]
MRAVANVMGSEDEGENATVNRRPSIVVLQNMLRKIPPSPFHHQHQSPDPSSPHSAGSMSNQVRRASKTPVAGYNPFHSRGSENGTQSVAGVGVNLDGFLASHSGSASGLIHGVDLNSPAQRTEDPLEQLCATGSDTGELFQDFLGDLNAQVAEVPSGGLLDPPGVSETMLLPSPKPDKTASFYSTGSSLFRANGADISQETPFAYSTLSGADVFSPSSNVGSPVVRELFRYGDGDGGESGGASDLFGTGPVSSRTDVWNSAVRTTYLEAPRDVQLAALDGSKHDILRATPFVQARNLSAASDSSPTESDFGVKLVRRPPKPLPRSRAPRPDKPRKPTEPGNAREPELRGPPKPPPKPSKALPETVSESSAQPQDGKAFNSEDSYVLEDILLIGQEKCVEDWPEDSPQLDPDFKPSGKFRLRRESLKVTTTSDGERRDDFGSHVKKKDRKYSFLSRGASKEKISDHAKDARSWTLPLQGKSPKVDAKEGASVLHFPSGVQEYWDEASARSAETGDGEQSWSEQHKKKPLKNKVHQLLRRSSTSLVQQHSLGKDDVLLKKMPNLKDSAARWHSQEAMVRGGVGEASAQPDDAYASKGKKKFKMKFTPQKGSSNFWTEHPQGAHGWTPAHADAQDGQEPSLAAAKAWHRQEDLADFHPKQRSFSTLEDDDDDDDAIDDYKAKKTKMKTPIPLPRKPKTHQISPRPVESTSFARASRTETSYDDDRSDEEYGPSDGDLFKAPVVGHGYKKGAHFLLSGQKKAKRKGFGMGKKKNKAWEGGAEDAALDHLSEAARAEWLAAQKDERAAAARLENDQGDGDTDSLMEWWNTVKQWDELSSDEESKDQDESRSFATLADKVNRGLRVFNKVFTERAEVLWQHVVKLHALADHLATFHQKAKVAGITGGTTAAVGGVTAIAGLALAPFTFGASLIVTAVGVGVATAGGITSASASISDNVNNIQERKKVEAVLREYEFDFRDLAKILHFVNHGLYKLRGHPFLRSGTQHYSEDWEVRKAVQMISLVDSPVMRATEVTDANLELVQRLHSGMDKYFKDSRDMKKAFKKEVVARIKEAGNMLNDGVVELNAIREELQAAIGEF